MRYSAAMSLTSLTPDSSTATSVPKPRVSPETPQVSAETPRSTPSRRFDWAVGVLYLLGGLWVMGHGWKNPDKTPGHLVSDHYWFQWLLTHAAQSVAHLQNPFFSTQMNYPDGVNVLANTSILGIGIPLTPVTLIFGSSISYLAAVTLGLALTAFSTYYVLSRYLVQSRVAAAVGGALFGFAPGFVHHANGQPNFVMHFLIPLIVLFAVKLVVDSRPIRNGVILGLLVTYQVFINEEMLVFAAMASATIIGAMAVMRWQDMRQRFAGLAKGLAVTLAVSLPLLAYPLWYQFAGPQSFKSFGYFHAWGEDVSAYTTFSRDTFAGNIWVEWWIGKSEQNTWYGWPLVLLTAASVFYLWRRSFVARVATLTGATFALLGLGGEIRFRTVETGIPGPWKLLGHLPVIGMVTPSRLTFVVTGAIAVLAALFADRLLELARQHPEVPLKLVGGLAFLAALVPIAPWPLVLQDTPPVPEFISSGHWRTYVDEQHTLVPLPLPAEKLGTRALRWSASTLNTYNFPRGYFIGPHENREGGYGAPATPFSEFMVKAAQEEDTTAAAPSVTEEVRRSALEDVRHWRAAIAILEDDHPRAAVIKSAMDQLFGPAQYVDDVYLWDLRSLN